MKDKHITLEASGDFPFTFFIEKAVPLTEDGKLIVEGIASTLNVDHDNERMAKDALHAMARVINEKGVPLRMEHSKSDEAVLGDVYKAWVDDRNQLWIRAAIDPVHDTGASVHSDMKLGKKYGLSVGGRVKNAVRELVESTGNYVKTFYDVILDEVSVTRRPANYDSWLFAKSIKDKAADVSPYYDSPFYKQFLFENPKYDYIDQFAKSVPAEAWKKVDKSLKDINNKNENMKDDEKEKKEKAMDEKPHDQDGPDKDKAKDDGDKGTEKSYVSKNDFNKAMDMVAKGFKSLAGLIKGGLDSDAMDTANPGKKKEEVIGDKGDMKKGEREGQENEGGNGSDEKGEREKSDKDEEEKEKSAEDEDEKKEKSEDDEKKEKAEGDSKESREDREKSESSESREDRKEKAESDEEEKEKGEKDEDGDPAMKSMSDAISHINSLTKKMKGEKVSKSTKKEVVDDEGSIDDFAVAIAKSIDTLNDKFEKNGMRVPGLREKLLDIIKNDTGIQEEISKMMKVPGFKKSVSMGIPYIKDKDGRQYALTAKPTEKLEKSMEGKTFKDVFKTRFSSFAQENDQNQ